MSHPFGIYSERGASGVSSEEMTALLAPDVTLHGPFLFAHASGKEQVHSVLAEYFALLSYPKSTLELTDNQHTTALLWDTTFNGYDLHGIWIITEGTDGLIHKLVSYVRPFQVATFLQEALIPLAHKMLPAEVRALPPRQADRSPYGALLDRKGE